VYTRNYEGPSEEDSEGNTLQKSAASEPKPTLSLGMSMSVSEPKPMLGKSLAYVRQESKHKRGPGSTKAQ